MTANCQCSAHGSFLTAKGLVEAAQQLSLEGLAPRGEVDEVDSIGSVRGMVEVEVDDHYDPLHTELNTELLLHSLNGG